MRLHVIEMKTGIQRTKEFERKKLGLYSVNAGTKCGHGCTYCSSNSLLRRHPSHKAHGENPFEGGYATIDPKAPDRVEHDARRIPLDKRGMVVVSTYVDSWAPEARKYDIGPRYLKAILSQPGWTVRILSKCTAVEEMFPFLLEHRDRVLVGLSITGTPDKTDVVSAFELNPSPVRERIEFMRKAHRLGLRTYAMYCPLLPGIADSPKQVDELVQLAVEFGAEEIFVEALNARGKAIPNTVDALFDLGHFEEAAEAEAIRTGVGWSKYAVNLCNMFQRSVRRFSSIEKLRYLLYPNNLTSEYEALLKQDDAGVIWLGKEKGEEPEACEGC